MSTPVLGFIGIGMMGLPMASRLVAAGHNVVAFDQRDEALSAIAAKGAQRAGSPAEVASRADIVMTSLPTPDVVREVALGENGVVAGSRARLFVDLRSVGAMLLMDAINVLYPQEDVRCETPVALEPLIAT